MNNIYRDHNGYYIRKYFRGKHNSVSGFKTYEEAEKARSSFISAVENGTLQEWKDKFSPKNLKKLKTKNGKVAKNIYKSSKKYIVNKTVDFRPLLSGIFFYQKLWGNISDKWKDDPLNNKNKHKK